MKTAVIGSRSLTNLDISQYIPADTTMIILGGAKGIDSLAETYAYRNFIPVRIFFLIMSIMAKKAPLIRNREIVRACDRLIAIRDGKSRGTQDTIHCARTAGKIVNIYYIKD